MKSVYLCSALAIALIGCASTSKQVADTCALKDEEVPAGYTREECNCERQPFIAAVQTKDTRTPEYLVRCEKTSVTTQFVTPPPNVEGR